MSKVARRGLLLGLTGVTLYLLAPSLIAVLSSAPRLRTIEPLWFLPMLLLEGGSLMCMFVLQRICIRAERLGPVVSSGLAGNAAARVVPGGGAAGAALQYGMLTGSGCPAGPTASGLAAANILNFATLLALPVLTVPAVILGLPVSNGLGRAALIGFVGFAIMAALGALFATTTEPLAVVGRTVERLHNRLLRRRPPLRGVDRRLLRERDTLRGVLGNRWWEALLASVGRWMLDYGALLLALAAVGATPAVSLVLIAYVAAQVLVQLPITPGGIGVVEVGLTGFLVLAGVGAGDAALATLAYRLFSYWLPLPAGAIAVYIYRRHHREDAPVLG